MKFFIILTALGAFLASCAADTKPGGYIARLSLPLTVGPDRIAGRIELLEDERIRPEMRTAITEAYGEDPCDDRPPVVLQALCRTADKLPLRPALLRLRNASGEVIATRVAERPLADLAVLRLYGSDRRTYLFTVDLSAGFGSYSGPYTRLAEPDSLGFGWLLADTARAATDTITLVSTVKTAWRAVPRIDGLGQDLLMIRCRPDFSVPDSLGAAFLLTFQRYTFDGQRWLRRQRQQPGCYESDDPFPAITDFP